MTFAHPAMLWLLVAVPLAGWALFRRRRAELGAARAGVLAATVAAGVLCAVLAAAGPSRKDLGEPDVKGAVVADVSASMGESGLLRAGEVLAAAERDPAVIARLVYAGRPAPPPRALSLAEAADGSNPAAALDAAAAALGAAGPRRVLLVSDGGQTAGDVQAAAQRLAASGIAVDVHAAGAPRPVAITALDLPAQVRTGERIAVRVRLAAPVATEVEIRLGDDEPVKEMLDAGEGEVTLRWRAARAGVQALVLRATAAGVTDEAEALVEVLPPPRTLVVADGESAAKAALGEAGIGVATVTPATWPEDLRGFDAVVLDEIEAEALGPARVAELGAFVRAGGGLVAVPGEKGLAKGSADAAKALRRLLPLATIDDEKKEPPPVALVFILDRSDSMHRERKWEVAAKTTASAYYDLNPTSSVGLVIFSDFTDVIVPLTKVKDVPDFPKKVAAIRLQGGTNMFPSVKAAYEMLASFDARKKHVVLLSDGVSVSRLADNLALLERVVGSRITISTVAMGSEADQPTMAEIARICGGRYWYVSNPDDLPRIFAEETKRSAVEDEDVPLAALEKKEIAAFASLDPAKAAWTRTTHARTRATTETLWQLDAPDTPGGRQAKRPLLGRARYGAGRAVALAAPLAAAPVPRGELAAAMLRAAIAPPADALGVRADARRVSDGTRVSLARLEPGALAQGWSVEVVAGDGAVEERVALTPEGTDRAAAVVAHAGARLGRVLTPDGRPAAWVHLPADRAERLPWVGSLAGIAAATGGVVVPEGSLPAWMGRTPPRPTRPLRVPLGLAALALCAASVWIRRP